MTQISPKYTPKPFKEWPGKFLARLRALFVSRPELHSAAPLPAASAEYPGNSVSIEELKTRGNSLQARLDAAKESLRAREF